MTQAATCTAVSVSQSDVQNAVNNCSSGSGNTVVIPAGSATWTSPVVMNAVSGSSSSPFTIQGATTCTPDAPGSEAVSCTDNTSITDNTSGDNPALNVSGVDDSHFVRITGISFTSQANIADGQIQIYGSPNNNFTGTVDFRLDHVHIIHSTNGGRGISTVGVYGLIDHLVVDVTDTQGSDQSISIYGSSIGEDGGFTPWMSPLALGTANAVYVEDSTLNYANQHEDSVDAYTGARLVIRHNSINNDSVGFHGTDSGDNRSVFSYEIYNNTFTNNSTTTLRGATLRGGTGVIYSNTYTGSHGSWYDITPMVYRACEGPQSNWQSCNGSNWEIGSKDFSTNASRTCSANGGVKFCSISRDTVCTSDNDCPGSETCSTYFDGPSTGGYACRDQVGRTHNQILSPLYAWNNGSVGITPYDGGGTNCGGFGIGNYLTSGSDYNNGTQMPGYVAYTYPHPLQTGGGAPPSPPTNLNAQVQ